MSGYLQRIASSALTPGGAIHPVLGSIFSDSAYRRTPENSPGKSDFASSNRPEFPVTPQQEGGVPPRAWKESVTPPPTARIHPRATPVQDSLASEVPPVPTPASAPDHAEQTRNPGQDARTSFKPLVNKGLQREIDRPSVPPFIMSDRPRGQEEPKGVHSKKSSELSKSAQEASPVSQNAKLEPRSSVDNVPPSKSMTSVSGKAQRDWSAETVSEERTSFKPLVIKAHQKNVAEPDAELKGRDKPVAAESFSPADQLVIFREASALVTPDAQKGEKRDLPLHSGLPQREPDEIQIHIGRIEVVAVPPAPAPPAALKPQRGAPSLDEYLQRRDRKAQ